MIGGRISRDMTACEFISQRPRDGSSMAEKNRQDAGADPDTVRSRLNRVTRSQAFVSSPRIRRFVEFIVEAKLAGDVSRLKAYTIGVEVFDRPPDFDPESESIVRVSAIRLQRMLDLDYAGGLAKTR